MEAKSVQVRPLQSRLRLAGRVVGIVIISLLLIMLVADAVDLTLGGSATSGETAVFAIAPVLAASAAFLVSWKFQRTGAWLVILSYLLMCISPSVRSLWRGAGLILFRDMWLYALPLLASGVLLLVSSPAPRKSRTPIAPEKAE